MARQTINIGSSPNKGDGDPLRTAFDKVNDNFIELYTANGDISGAAVDVLPSTDGAVNLGSADKQWADVFIADFIYLNGTKIEVNSNGALLVGGSNPIQTQDTVGSVFGDDSTLLVDGVNNIIPSANISGTEAANWDTAFAWGDHSTAGYAPQATTYTKVEVDAAIAAVDPFSGDVTGSVFADDSTLLVDGVGGTIAGPISSINWMAASDSYLTISNGGSTGPGPIQIVASANLDLSSGTNNDINITPHGSGRVKVSDGAFGIVEAANFIGHADETMYLSSKTTSAESTHIALDSTSGVATTMYGDVTMQGSFTPPMLTQAEIDALTPTLGMMVYNTTTGKFQGYAADANNDSTTSWADLH